MNFSEYTKDINDNVWVKDDCNGVWSAIVISGDK